MSDPKMGAGRLLHEWGEEWASTGSHPGAVFRVCQACAVRVCTACAPNYATDTACPKRGED